VSSPTEPAPATALGEALAARGLRVEVEALDTLAILVAPADSSLDWSAERHEIVQIARRLGFSHVALELSARGGE
jgi:hypothetical protein